MVAHAVGHDLVLRRGRSNDNAAGTHAEGVNAAVACLAGQAVFRCAETGMPRIRAELRSVYEFLRMLDADADCEGLLHYLNALCEQHAVGIPCRLTDSKHCRAAGDYLGIIDGDGSNAPVIGGKIGHAGTEADINAHLFQPAADIEDDL